MILVVGATGMVGSEICLRLAARGKKVRAMVRSTSNQAKVANLKKAGIEIAPRIYKREGALGKEKGLHFDGGKLGTCRVKDDGEHAQHLSEQGGFDNIENSQPSQPQPN